MSKIKTIRDLEIFFNQNYYTLTQVANKLGSDRKTILSWLQKYKWDYAKIGNRIKIPKTTVRDIIMKIYWKKGRARYDRYEH